MPGFGEKRFKYTERQEIVKKLNGNPPSYLINNTGKGQTKEISVDLPNLISLAHQIFGFDGWSHSVTHESIDFVDYDGKKYNVGVSAIVKVILKDGTFHEDVGYGESTDLEQKGPSYAKARKAAADNALKHALSTFGKGLGNGLYHKKSTKKIDDFLQPSQRFAPRANATLSGVKRKLTLEFDTVSSQNNNGLAVYSKQQCLSHDSGPKQIADLQSVTVRQSPVTAYSIYNEPCSSSSNIHTYHPNVQQSPGMASDDSQLDSPLLSRDISNLPSTPCNEQKRDLKLPVPDVSSQPCLPCTVSPLNREKMQRKLKQLDLELKAREEVKTNLLLQLQKLDSGADCSPNEVDITLVKKEPSL